MNHTIINEKLEAYYATAIPETILTEFENMGVEFVKNAFKKNDTIIVHARGTNHIGTVIGRKRREDVVYYDVMVDSYKLYEGLTINPTFPVHVNEQLSHKFQNNILKTLDNATK